MEAEESDSPQADVWTPLEKLDSRSQELQREVRISII